MGLESSRWSTTSKWLGFVTAVWVQAIAGNNYTFSNYSDALKSIMDLTQLQLNILSVLKDVGKVFGLVAGFSSDRLSTPVMLLIGSVEGLIGYGAQWLVVSQITKPLPYWAMCIFMCMGGNSSTWMNTAVLVTCIRNFRKNRGPVSGILKGYIGLTTAILTDLCVALFSDSSSAFVLMLAIVPFAICVTAALFLREVPPSSTLDTEKDESRYLGITNIIAVVVAVYLLAYDVSGTHSSLFNLVFAAILIIILASPLSIPIYVSIQALKPSNSVFNSDVERQDTAPLLEQETAAAGEVENPSETAAAQVVVVVERRRPVIGEDHTIFEAMKTVDFWILFVGFLCGAGPFMMVMNNLGQMGLALGFVDVSIFLSLLSIAGFFGRILAGWISEYFIKKAAIPRPIWNGVSQIGSAVGFVVMALAVPGSLYVGSVLIGLCYGVRLAVTVPTASEQFGLKYYGLIYNVLILNIPIGSLLFSALIAGYLYDAQATALPDGSNTCTGAHCYRLVYVIMAITSIVGCGLDCLLALRTKAIFFKIHESKKSK